MLASAELKQAGITPEVQLEIAKRGDYKPGSTKRQLKWVWRWMKDGYKYNDIVESWRFKNE